MPLTLSLEPGKWDRGTTVLYSDMQAIHVMKAKEDHIKFK